MNMVQVICGCAGAETIEECARVPEMLGAKVIVVHGMWPKIRYVSEESKHAYTQLWAKPNYHVDNVAEVARKKGWTFIQMQEYAYNGAQYNMALKYMEQAGIKPDYLWFTDSDECVDPVYADALENHLSELRATNKAGQLRFGVRREILPGWRYLDDPTIINGNEGIVLGEYIGIDRKTDFDGNHFFVEDVPYTTTDIPLIHLHNLRSNACNRVREGVFYSGSVKAFVEEQPKVEETEYIRYLKTKFTKFYEDREGEDSYVGSAIFDLHDNDQ